MFPRGSSQMYPQARELLRKVVLTVDRLPHRISVVGHTDSAPFANDRGYSNWELSADRANASRRALVELGLPAERIVPIVRAHVSTPVTKPNIACRLLLEN